MAGPPVDATVRRRAAAFVEFSETGTARRNDPILVAPVPIVVHVCRCCDDAGSFRTLLSRETLAVSSQATCGPTAYTAQETAVCRDPTVVLCLDY
jgi:hypothetical protein